MSSDSVIIVGNGISGLITAYHLNQAGFDVKVVTQSPQIEDLLSELDCQSSTWDGQDQRYITLFEGHPYLDLINYVCSVYPDIGNDFLTEVIKGGWLASPCEEFDERSQQWLRARAALNSSLHLREKEAVEKVQLSFSNYTAENRFAMRRWCEMLCELIQSDSGLVEKISLHADGIIRLYDVDQVYRQAIKTHKEEGVLRRILSPKMLAEEMPSYAA
ncbi:MAG: hypothetical protein K1X29_10705 [Bdellovibrionales bacterium]|nr:hypothetical protein [Bdellovibrionales bacterium]